MCVRYGELPLGAGESECVGSNTHFVSLLINSEVRVISALTHRPKCNSADRSISLSLPYLRHQGTRREDWAPKVFIGWMQKVYTSCRLNDKAVATRTRRAGKGSGLNSVGGPPTGRVNRHNSRITLDKGVNG